MTIQKPAGAVAMILVWHTLTTFSDNVLLYLLFDEREEREFRVTQDERWPFADWAVGETGASARAPIAVAPQANGGTPFQPAGGDAYATRNRVGGA